MRGTKTEDSKGTNIVYRAARVQRSCLSALFMLISCLLFCEPLGAQVDSGAKAELQFPVKPTMLVQGKFQRSEGIAFNGEGDLFVTANHALWRISTKGEPTKIVDLYSNLGLAPIGKRDMLVADFGPTNGFAHGPNDDGMVWRVTPEGEKITAATGMGDPNFVLVLKDGSFLVSDDATNEIFIVDREGKTSLFTTVIDHPNGLALSQDGATLYVAQIFRSIRPIVADNRVWALPLDGGRPKGEPKVVTETGLGGANDGLAMDVEGRVYIAANGEAKIWRFDPKTEKLEVIARRMPGVASLAFGQGEFDHHAIYATSTRAGLVWKVPVGVRGAPLHH